MKYLGWMLAGLLSIPALSAGQATADTVSCAGKRGWQHRIVERSVHAWFGHAPDPDDLLRLVQAEHGIAACTSRAVIPARLHSTRLPVDLELEQFGAVLLANELEWRGLVPPPEQELLGKIFRVRRLPGRIDDAGRVGPTGSSAGTLRASRHAPSRHKRKGRR